MPDYSIFRGYIIASTMFPACPPCSGFWEQKSLMYSYLFPSQQYNLVNRIEASDAYTVFAPNNDAIENYIRQKKVASLVRIGNDDQGNHFLEIQTLNILQFINHESFYSSTKTSFS